MEEKIMLFTFIWSFDFDVFTNFYQKGLFLCSSVLWPGRYTGYYYIERVFNTIDNFFL